MPKLLWNLNRKSMRKIESLPEAKMTYYSLHVEHLGAPFHNYGADARSDRPTRNAGLPVILLLMKLVTLVA